jgi:ribonuclease R
LSARERRRPALEGRHVALIGRRGRFAVCEPLFEPGPQVALQRADRRAEGRIAFVELSRGKARMLRDLGRPDRARDVVDALLWERLGWRGFRRAHEAEAAEAARVADAAPSPRRDLTERPTFTVDPATARDFDDAVSAEREGDGVRLWIHIADVAAHVTPGTALDREARRRANSTYVPGSVEPMLPFALSSEACSLAAGVERLAVTAEIALDGAGRPTSTSFYRSRIRSDARIDYDELDEIFSARRPAPPPVAAPLAIAREAAAALGERRRGGALEVDSREPEFSFDENGDVTAARSVEQTESHRLIEHLMVLTNERVAELVERKKVPTLYRVHEQPDTDRVRRLFDQLASLDLPTPPLPDRLNSREAGALVAEASRLVIAEAARRGHGRDAYTSLVLRALSQAHYSDRNLGHAGLASPAYCHFTSPIRRYPDLIAHRGLLAVTGEGEDPPSAEEAREAGWECSERERESARLERDADDVCAAFLLERELFESGWQTEFGGEVSGLIGAGAFVRFAGELADVYEGFLPARRLRGERFELNEHETALVGQKTGRRVRLGDPVAVTVSRVEAARGRVDLEPADG